MNFDPHDPQWTAYVLGELDGKQRFAVEKLLRREPAARQLVDDIRQTIGLLSDQLAREPAAQLTAEQQQAIDRQWQAEHIATPAVALQLNGALQVNGAGQDSNDLQAKKTLPLSGVSTSTHPIAAPPARYTSSSRSWGQRLAVAASLAAAISFGWVLRELHSDQPHSSPSVVDANPAATNPDATNSAATNPAAPNPAAPGVVQRGLNSSSDIATQRQRLEFPVQVSVPGILDDEYDRSALNPLREPYTFHPGISAATGNPLAFQRLLTLLPGRSSASATLDLRREIQAGLLPASIDSSATSIAFGQLGSQLAFHEFSPSAGNGLISSSVLGIKQDKNSLLVFDSWEPRLSSSSCTSMPSDIVATADEPYASALNVANRVQVAHANGTSFGSYAYLAGSGSNDGDDVITATLHVFSKPANFANTTNAGTLTLSSGSTNLTAAQSQGHRCNGGEFSAGNTANFGNLSRAGTSSVTYDFVGDVNCKTLRSDIHVSPSNDTALVVTGNNTYTGATTVNSGVFGGQSPANGKESQYALGEMQARGAPSGGRLTPDAGRQRDRNELEAKAVDHSPKIKVAGKPFADNDNYSVAKPQYTVTEPQMQPGQNVVFNYGGEQGKTVGGTLALPDSNKFVSRDKIPSISTSASVAITPCLSIASHVVNERGDEKNYYWNRYLDLAQSGESKGGASNEPPQFNFADRTQPGPLKSIIDQLNNSPSNSLTVGVQTINSAVANSTQQAATASTLSGEVPGNSGLLTGTTNLYSQTLAGIALDSAAHVNVATNQVMPVFDPQSREAYQALPVNRFIAVADDPLSTFATDVDTGSYTNLRRYLTERGQLPPPDAVRVEEMLNYFRYDYPQAKADDAFAVQCEVAQCPWEGKHRLARIGIKAKEIAKKDRPVTNLVFLIDVSGSMSPEDRLPLIQRGLNEMVDQLTENDRVAVVYYAAGTGMALPSTRGDKKDVIKKAINKLGAGGSTNGAGGIELAYKVARENFIERGVNRVILATDGDFNVGITDRDQLITLIQDTAKAGISLTTLGVGTDNLKDATLEQLADKGHGNYAYLDSLAEARRVLVEQINGTLVTVAKDMKVQIEFNPAEIQAYRLIGYENRIMPHADFNNDKKLGGDVGAGHTVTALYELTPVERSDSDQRLDIDPLKYQKKTVTTDAAGTKELFTLKLRYKQPHGDKSSLQELPIKDSGKRYGQASRDFKFAASVAAFGMALRRSPFKGDLNMDAIAELAQEGIGSDDNGSRKELVDLIHRAKALGVR